MDEDQDPAFPGIAKKLNLFAGSFAPGKCAWTLNAVSFSPGWGENLDRHRSEENCSKANTTKVGGNQAYCCILFGRKISCDQFADNGRSPKCFLRSVVY